MTDLISHFDTYARKARVYPALLTLLPPVVLALSAIPALSLPNVAGTAATLLVSFGVLYLLADLARGRGVEVQARLLEEWGGWPTTLLMLRADRSLPEDTKNRYRHILQQRVPHWNAPSAADEQTDPAAAASSYDAAVDWLKAQCRGTEFALVHRENANYGFRRNLRGLKPVGLALALISLAVGCWIALQQGTLGGLSAGLQSFNAALVSPLLWGSIALSAAASAYWTFVARNAYVRHAADAYARALLACCDKL